MLFHRFNNENTSMSASAPCANAEMFCAYSANTAIIMILDAIIVASIIICGLITILGILGLVLVVLLVILAAVRLAVPNFTAPLQCESVF